jgi:hypothetical protein
MAGVYQFLATAVTPGGKRPDIIVATPIPILKPEYAAADAFLNSTLMPWIKSQVAEMQAHGLPVTLLDTNTEIRQQPGWESWYSDGIHLFGANQAGYTWLASAVLNAVLDQRRGDANLDGVVDGLDYVAWSDRFVQPGNWSQGDFNHDGSVDGLDYVLWADQYAPGAEAGPNLALVPETVRLEWSAAGLLVAAVARARRRGRRLASGSQR